MSGLLDATDQPVRFNERSGRGILRRVGWYIAILCIGEFAFALGRFETNWIYAYWAFLWLAGWLSNTLAMTEWTITGPELRRRRWLSRPGSEASAPIVLGPQVECVRVSWFVWRISPGGFDISLQPWQTARLVGAMERAGVHIDNWRANWSRQHRLINALGVLGYAGGAVAIAAVIAMGGLRPGGVGGFVTYGAAIGGFCLGLAVDYLPWKMRRASTQAGRP